MLRPPKITTEKQQRQKSHLHQSRKTLFFTQNQEYHKIYIIPKKKRKETTIVKKKNKQLTNKGTKNIIPTKKK